MAIPMRLRRGRAPLTLKDVMASLGDGAVDKETAKRLAKIAKTKAVDAPLARPIQERIDRKAASRRDEQRRVQIPSRRQGKS